MTDHIELTQEQLVEITPEMKYLLNDTRARLKGTDRRQFMAHVVLIMGKGGQRMAEKELGWTSDAKTKRVWGRLEQYWNGELLNNVDKVLGLARTMTCKGCHPVVNMIKEIYKKVVRLTKKAMNKIEDKISRSKGIEKWAVNITCYPD